MSQVNNSRVSGTLKYSAYLIAIAAPLIASTLQAGRVSVSMGSNLLDQFANGIMAGSIICSSVIIGLLVGKCFSNGMARQALFGCVVWMGIVTFSTITSSLAQLDTANRTIDKQIAESSTAQGRDALIASNMATMKSLQQQIDSKDPIRWASKRERWAAQKASIAQQNAALIGQSTAAGMRGEGSALAKSFKQLSVSQSALVYLSSLLLDAIPFAVAVMLGGLGGRREVFTVKKPQAPRGKLRAV